MKNSNVVALTVAATVAVVTVVVVATLTVVALWDRDDGWGPGMMSSTSQQRDPGGDGRGWAMFGPGMHPGMQAVVRSESEFLVEMIAHHEEAIIAAGELARSDRPEMRELGLSIVEGQTAEVERMRAWLGQWYPDVSTAADYDPMMRDLDDLSGDDLDRVFLEDMIGHHMAAVMMSHQLVVRGLADHAEVEELARSISSSQHAEMLTMRRWLFDWFG